MAEVYMAKTSGIGGFEKVLALKVIHPNYAEDQEFIDMLVDEAKLAVQLTHRNIAQVFDLGKVNGSYFIAMEFIDGKDLYQLMVKCSELEIPIPFDLVSYVGTEMNNGLHYAHTRADNYGRPLNLIHRDVSPQNVLLSHEGDVKLVDFGIAKANQRRQQTEAGVIKGKFCYMSPEQAWGEELDARSDVFASGICLYEMVAGEVLFLEGSALELLEKVRRADVPPITSLRPDVPPELARIIHRALCQDREDRYPSAAEMQADLANFLHQNWPRFNSRQLGGFLRTVFGDQRFVLPEPEEKQIEHKKAESTVEIMQAKEFDRSGVHSVIFDLGGLGAPNAGDRPPQTFDERDDQTVASEYLVEPAAPEAFDPSATSDTWQQGGEDPTRLLPNLVGEEALNPDDGGDTTAIFAEPAAVMPAEQDGDLNEDELEGPTIVFDSSVVARALSEAPDPVSSVASSSMKPEPAAPSSAAPPARPPSTRPISRDGEPSISPAARPHTTPPDKAETPRRNDQTLTEESQKPHPPLNTTKDLSQPAILPSAKQVSNPSVKVATPRKAKAEKPAKPKKAASAARAKAGPDAASEKGQWAIRMRKRLFGAGGISIVALILLTIYALTSLLPGLWATPVKDQAWLLVQSAPEGARVVIDGRDTGKTTNGRISQLKLGTKHRVELELEGYRRHAAFIRLDEKNTGGNPLTGTYRVELKTQGNVVEIATDPAGADVYADGLYLGISPLVQRNVERKGDTVMILIHKDGYIDQRRTLPWGDDGRIDIKTRLDKGGP
jgi:serine/threonine protein kinase